MGDAGANQAPVSPDGRNVTASPVVTRGYCIGCGVCAGVCPSGALSMELRGDEYRPVQTGACSGRCGLCVEVCPFADSPDDETSLAAELFADEPGLMRDDLLGSFVHTCVGAVADDDARAKSASGGAASALLAALLEAGMVDAVVATTPICTGTPWFRYEVLTTPSQVAASRGSAYQPVHLAHVLAEMLRRPARRYAVIAVPCYAKALRRAARRLPALRERLTFVLGLTCGGCPGLLYPTAQSMLAGVPEPVAINHRRKMNALSARNMVFVATGREGRERFVGLDGIGGFLWSNRIFRKGCSFCDDVFAELADATFMDAWLPEFEADPRGGSLIVFRRESLRRLWDQRQAQGLWQGQPIAPEQVIASQSKVCRNRRQLLQALLQAVAEEGQWAPRKRAGLLKLPDGESPAKLVRAAARMLRASEAIRALGAAWLESIAGRSWSPLGARVEAWRFCRRVAGELRRIGVKPSQARTLWIPRWLSHPLDTFRKRRSWRRARRAVTSPR